MKKKSKKEKVVYIDDGRTIADMSGVTGRPQWTKRGTTSSVRDILRTYFGAMRMMLLPTLAVCGILLAAFAIVALLFWLM